MYHGQMKCWKNFYKNYTQKLTAISIATILESITDTDTLYKYPLYRLSTIFAPRMISLKVFLFYLHFFLY